MIALEYVLRAEKCFSEASAKAQRLRKMHFLVSIFLRLGILNSRDADVFSIALTASPTMES